MKKILIFFCTINLFAFFALQNIFAMQNSKDARISVASQSDIPSNTALADAYNAYKNAEYDSAIFLFRKALTDAQNQSDGALYMLVMAQMRIGEYKGAYADAEYFLNSYPQSLYTPIVKYQQGRSLFYLEDYEKAVLVLGDFCHENPSDAMYPSALFWIAECFYAGYNFNEAKPFYERILAEFSTDSKAIDAKYRLDAIVARAREEKLLYMLQQTGENYLSSKESYEKALLRYEFENSLVARPPRNIKEPEDEPLETAVIIDNSPKNDDASKVGIPQTDIESVAENAPSVQELDEKNSFAEALLRLKMSAAEAQNLLDDRGFE